MDDTGATVHRNRMPIAAASGVVAWLLFWLAADWGFFWSLIAGLIVFGIVLLLLGLIGRDDAASAPPSSASSRPQDAPQSAVPPTVAGGGAAAGGGAPAATSPAMTGTPLGEGARAGGTAPAAEAEAPPAEASANQAGVVLTPEPAPQPTNRPAPGAPDDALPASARKAVETPSTPTVPVPDAMNEGGASKPATLDAPRDGKGDDLKKIKGVGPKLERQCNELGFWHFDQIAAWTDAEVAWVDSHLEGFRGRVSRDDWVSQAKTLALGGATEFSRRGSADGAR
ncbi:hypothetical protein [Jannaschia rubra]|uniref:NADH dehydrogenase subunit E n=1 Tax=Jannaschia rubra TaxID=282197 RepID=A0A0M6XSD5_9RHOB|nr:hypothetical protein [Jannaschia rubra]CTQ33572.1 NADH dehydrogenase subunit E [Jannaschia rubra]SFG04125.1 Predicted 5' DNA nuclease, flap endonuclease-1-like, helix-3-turn-helix (H3TH) domain [Jannaschia rubra]